MFKKSFISWAMTLVLLGVWLVLPASVLAQSSCNDAAPCTPPEYCSAGVCVGGESSPPPGPTPTPPGPTGCEDDTGCIAPQICKDHVCSDRPDASVDAVNSGNMKNVYCLQGSVCQPKDPSMECPSGWTQSPRCPCPDRPEADCIPIENPLVNNTTSIFTILGTVLRIALGIIGSLTLLMFVWGGFQWLASGGNPERIKKGTDTMLWAAIGVFCVFASYFVLSNFVEYLTGSK